MPKIPYSDIIRLRFLVGYLGEKAQAPWWRSDFFTPGSSAFLTPVFPNTAVLAQYNGIKGAACKIHDERIGTGMGIFHLFRLPTAIEQEMHNSMSGNQDTGQLGFEPANPDEAMQLLCELSENGPHESVPGPIRIGSRPDLGKRYIWKTIAGYYYNAFLNGQQTFPYFSGEKAVENKGW